MIDDAIEKNPMDFHVQVIRIQIFIRRQASISIVSGYFSIWTLDRRQAFSKLRFVIFTTLIDIKSWHFNGDQLSRPISINLHIPHPRFQILRVELSSFSPSSCLEMLINLIDHVFRLSVMCQEAHSPQIFFFAARNDIFSTTKAWYCLRWEM
jgi:hypothetical protein